MKKILLLFACIAMLFLLHAQVSTKNSANTVFWLDEMNLETMETGWGQPQARATINAIPLRMGGQPVDRGVGSHANSEYTVNLHNNVLSFEALVGIDDEVGNNHGSVNFKILKDGKLVWESGIMREKETPKSVKIDLAGAKLLSLVVEDGNDNSSWDHADWGMAKFILKPGASPPTPLYKLPPGKPFILTPPLPLHPRINGPEVYGARPGSPFLYLIPATGKLPLRYHAEHLPIGLQLDSSTGIISGAVKQKGKYRVRLIATNSKGVATKPLEIMIGDTIALTPPLGWNSWNCFETHIDQAKIKSAADVFITKGLARHGWSYINIDDGWQGKRDSSGYLSANSGFPDMQGLGDYLHKKGLKLGIYSSPGPKTCGNFAGSGGYEARDVQNFASWGVDYLKYDWCSCRNPDLKAPYRFMDSLLKQTGRDIFFSICQYGMGNVWKWGVSAGGNAWRTNGDINDSWGSLNIGFGQNGLESYAGPGHWNDPDMMIVGWVSTGINLHNTRLRPDEQYTHVTLWSIMAAPLLIGCDLTKLDDFTLGLLCNDEVIAINQDRLGKQASRIAQNGKKEIWAKALADGSYAVAFFNRGLEAASITLDWNQLLLTGAQRIRDCWRQKNIGIQTNRFTAKVNAHGTLLLKITPIKKAH